MEARVKAGLTCEAVDQALGFKPGSTERYEVEPIKAPIAAIYAMAELYKIDFMDVAPLLSFHGSSGESTSKR